MCGEEILAVAVRCKHCQADLSGAGATTARKPGEGLGIALLLVPLTSTVLMWLWVGQMNLLQNPSASLMMLVILTVAITAVLVGVEASQLGMGGPRDLNDSGKRRSGPGAWAIFQVVMWALAYPMYLFWRSRYGAKNLIVGAVVVCLVFLGSAVALNASIEAKKAEIRQNFEQLRNSFGQFGQ